MPRTYLPKRLRGIMSPERYAELTAFCRGYDGKAAEADRLSARKNDGTITDQQARELRGLQSDLDIIRRAAREAGGGGWQSAILLCVCQGVPYEALRPRGIILPSDHHPAWAHACNDFFRLLHKHKNARDWRQI